MEVVRWTVVCKSSPPNLFSRQYWEVLQTSNESSNSNGFGSVDAEVECRFQLQCAFEHGNFIQDKYVGSSVWQLQVLDRQFGRCDDRILQVNCAEWLAQDPRKDRQSISYSEDDFVKIFNDATIFEFYDTSSIGRWDGWDGWPNDSVFFIWKTNGNVVSYPTQRFFRMAKLWWAILSIK